MTIRIWAAEAVAAFCLVFAGTGSIVVNQISGGQLTVVGIGLVFGLIVMGMIGAAGKISGAHMNPAVTLAFWAAGRLKKSQVLPYISAQLIGAVMASLLLHALFRGQPTTLGVTLPSGSVLQSFGLETVMSFILMFVILGVSHGGHEEGVAAGLAIGATVAVEAIFGGPVSGASMNPARSFAPALVSMQWMHHWIYWVAPVLGCLAAVGLQRFINKAY